MRTPSRLPGLRRAVRRVRPSRVVPAVRTEAHVARPRQRVGLPVVRWTVDAWSASTGRTEGTATYMSPSPPRC